MGCQELVWALVKLLGNSPQQGWVCVEIQHKGDSGHPLHPHQFHQPDWYRIAGQGVEEPSR